jgi:hypothetical protein
VILISISRLASHASSWPKSEIALYLASVVKRKIAVCLVAFQVMWRQPESTTNPVADLLVSRQLPQSASTKEQMPP